MNKTDSHNDKASAKKRPLIITVICIIGLLISLLEISGHFYATQIDGTGFENEWTIYLKIIPFINIVCWIGFWYMRKLTLLLYLLNLTFSMWTQFKIGVLPIDFYIIVYMIIAIIMTTHLSKMTKYI